MIHHASGVPVANSPPISDQTRIGTGLRFPTFVTLDDADEADARIRNERLRVLAVSLGAVLTGGGLFFRVFMSEHGFPNNEWPFVLAIIVLFFIVYECISCHLLTKALRSGADVSRIKVVFDSVLEGSLPFALGFAAILDTFANPFMVPGPLVLASTMLIFLSVLRLDFWMSLLTGLSSTCLFVLLGVWIYTTHAPRDYNLGPVLNSGAFLPVAGTLLLATTLIAMFISHQAQGWLRTALKMAESDRLRQEAERELELASAVQRQLLPAEPPMVQPFDVAARSRPAGRLSGDFYDWFEIEPGKFLLCIADVTGHGAASAMIGAESRAYLRAAAREQTTLVEILRTMESMVDFDLKAGTFLTLALISLELDQGRIRLLSAGHGPILKLSDGGEVVLLETQLPPLGVAPTPEHVRPSEIFLTPGDFIVLFSDGIMDRTNPDGEDFGQKRIEHALSAAFPENSADVVDLLFRESELFASGSSPPDDSSVLVVGLSKSARNPVA